MPMETSSRADRDQDPEAPPGPSSFPGRDQAGTLEFDRLYAGDCLQLFPRVASGSIDLVFADPPFNIGYDYDIYDDRLEAEAYLDWTRSWGREVVRALKPDGTFWLAIGDEYAAEMKVLFHRELGLSLRNWVIWYYTFGVHCTRKFSRSHAHLFYFVKDPKRFTFNDQSIRVPSARQLVYFDSRANPEGRLPDDTWILRPQDVDGGFAPESDTWYLPRVCGTFKERAGWHGCQMPEQLLGRIIRGCSNPGADRPRPLRRQRHDLDSRQEAGPSFPRLRALSRLCQRHRSSPRVREGGPVPRRRRRTIGRGEGARTIQESSGLTVNIRSQLTNITAMD